jgi:uncharacterized protein YgbK (DUF1537 family)
MLEMLVVADDLTGAADCAAPWATQGLGAIVLRDREIDPPESQVLAIDAATRSQTPEAAAARTAALVVAQAGRRKPRALYKKMDSTLRGHVGPELAAALHAWRNLDPAHASAVAILAPAFPATGRTTRGGRQCVNGAPLPQDLAAMLEASGLRTALVPRGRFGVGAGPAADAGDVDVWICDAETEEDLFAIAKVAASRGPNAVWAGSGGLARHAPGALGLPPRPAKGRPARAVEGPLLFVVGSLTEVSRQQAAGLGAAPSVSTASLRRETLLTGPGSSEWSRGTESLRTALDRGNDAVVSITPGPEPTAEDPALATALARFAAPHAARCAGLVLTGGDTARALLLALDVPWLRIVDELEPGMPLCVADPGIQPIVTKAGGFGDAETLRRCRARMKENA